MQPFEIITLTANSLLRVFSLSFFSFLVAIFLTPFWTNFLYRHKLGKHIRRTDYAGKKAPVFTALHKSKEGTPTMGGVLIWVTVALVTIAFNFNREGTWLPLFALLATGIIGALDDLLNIIGLGPNRGGLRFWHKLFIYLAIASAGAWWFAYKLDWINRPLHFPGVGDLPWGFGMCRFLF